MTKKCDCGRPVGQSCPKQCCLQCKRWGQHTVWCDRRAAKAAS